MTEGKIIRAVCNQPCYIEVIHGALMIKKSPILRRTERAMLRAMCVVKLMDRKNTIELITELGLKALMKMAANAPRWFGYESRAEDDTVKMALNFEDSGKRKKRC